MQEFEINDFCEKIKLRIDNLSDYINKDFYFFKTKAFKDYNSNIQFEVLLIKENIEFLLNNVKRKDDGRL